MVKMYIYVASSWRNPKYEEVLSKVKDRFGSANVYDFKNPFPGDRGFGWSQIDKEYKTKWASDYDAYRQALDHFEAEHGFGLDMAALEKADVCLLVLPCGKSAHLELGFAVGEGKFTVVLLEHETNFEPELMYKMCSRICIATEEALDEIAEYEKEVQIIKNYRL